MYRLRQLHAALKLKMACSRRRLCKSPWAFRRERPSRLTKSLNARLSRGPSASSLCFPACDNKRNSDQNAIKLQFTLRFIGAISPVVALRSRDEEAGNRFSRSRARLDSRHGRGESRRGCCIELSWRLRIRRAPPDGAMQPEDRSPRSVFDFDGEIMKPDNSRD